MGLLERMGKSHIPSNASFVLTEQGREIVQEFGGDPMSRIMTALETRASSSNIQEIAATSGLRKRKVEHFIPILMHRGFIRYVNNTSLEDI